MGVIRAASMLEESRFSQKDRDELYDLYDWFNDYLIVPNRFAKSPKRYAEKRAISWFKDTSEVCISKARKIADLLEKYNIRTEMLKSKNPGYVVYEDEDQVAAIPFS